MGCLKSACRAENEPVLRCVWNDQKQGKIHVNCYDYGVMLYQGCVYTIEEEIQEIVYLCNIMDRNQINNNIINYLMPYGPERIGLFGSFARGEESPESDIDILVKFRETISLLDLVRIHNELSKKLGRKIDLVTEPSLKNERLKKHIFKDLQIIYD